ncbi:MAG: gliding motility-associated C-terminal domain-containing protein [Bacteroidota bacterium]|nr:gliding motility-associated C-terminal domain-containing protein [Bacteroidota bacterium]
MLIFSAFRDCYSYNPPNDNCSNALEIIIDKDGYGIGSFKSGIVDVTHATREKSELCFKELTEIGNCSKTIWFKFYNANYRNISVKLNQSDSSIPQIYAGFSVYKSNSCNLNLNNLSTQLVSITKFGTSGNEYLETGWYFIQVGCNQSAKGELWIDLDVSYPNRLNNDHYKNPSVIHNYFTHTIYLNNASIEAEEYTTLPSLDFDKSAWYKLEINEPLMSQMLYFKSNDPREKYSNYLYRIFEDTLTVDSLKNTKPFLKIREDGLIFHYNCEQNIEQKKYFMQIISKSNSSNFLNLGWSTSKNIEDKWNTPLTDNIIELKPKDIKTVNRSFNCQSMIKNHLCNQQLPEYYINQLDRYNSTPLLDTFRYAGYSIINIKEDGLFELQSSSVYNNNANQYLYQIIYEGDIRSNCNLNKVFDGNNRIEVCLKKGTYTILTCLKYIESYEVRLTYKLSKNNYHYNYHQANNPDKFTYDSKLFQLQSSRLAYFNNNITTVEIDSVKIKGKITYREVFITDDVNVDIVGQFCYIALFKGQLSKGEAKKIPSIDYKKTSRAYGINTTAINGNCLFLSKGHYTIITYIDTNQKSYECAPIEHWVNIIPNVICPPNNNTEPAFVTPINLNQNVLSNTSNFDGLNYIYNIPLCKSCQTQNFFTPNLSCNKKKIPLNNKLHYYTFYLDENASFNLNTNYELYKGNCLENNAILLDQNNIISPCKNGNICNLQGKQQYTLVAFVDISSKYLNNIVITFSKHYQTPNDFISKSFNLGNFSSNKSEESPVSKITCHTNTNMTQINKNDYYYKPTYNLPFLDTLNNKKNNNSGTLWYTFTASGKLSIAIDLISKKTSYYDIYLFKYKGDYNTSFKQVLNNNFDSTQLEFLSRNYQQYQNITFENSCDNNRYFVLISASSTFNTNEVSLKINAKQSNKNNLGDLCENAETGTFNNYGNYTLQTSNICHTYGNSATENQASDDIKSTWFKVKITQLKRFELGLRLSGASFKSYNVYGGNCNALTKLISLNNSYSYFKLSCMGSGEYFIQVITNKSTNQNIYLQIEITQENNTTCLPYDFIKPISFFKLEGGCHLTDTIQLINNSTKGEDIKYYWYLNDSLLSHETDVLIHRKNPLIKPENTFKLIVENTLFYTRDTFELKYLLDTTIYQFKINGPQISTCRDSLKLIVETDFRDPLNYEWKTYNNNLEYESIYHKNFTPPYNVYLKAFSENCIFRDTFIPNVIKSLRKYTDTLICPGGKYILKNHLNNRLMCNNKPIAFGDSMIFLESQNLRIDYLENYCRYFDSVDLVIEKGEKLLNIKENKFYCDEKSLILEYTKEPLLNYNWNTGETTPSISVDKSGIYKLKGDFSKCRSLDYTWNITFEKVKTNRLRDSVVCINQNIEFSSPYPLDFKIIEKTPKEQIVKINQKKNLILKVKRGECEINDTAIIDVYQSKSAEIDSLTCNHSMPFKFILDAGEALQYHWYQQQFRQRFLSIPNYGRYPVERIDENNCKDTQFFNVITNCEFNVFVPNIFTPNNDENNEIFKPILSGKYNQFYLKIINRWGEIIYESNSTEGWNGFYKGKLVSQGIYAYQVKVIDQTNKTYYYNGSFTLLY